MSWDYILNTEIRKSHKNKMANNVYKKNDAASLGSTKLQTPKSSDVLHNNLLNLFYDCAPNHTISV